jgi:hypothetical protein
MTDKEKKAYILKSWNVSSGKKITEMCKRYFSSREVKNSGKPGIYEKAQEIFNG